MKLKILHLEDTPTDAELVERELRRGNLDFEKLVVSDRPGFIKALDEFAPDIIISDHSLPSFNSIEALEIIKSKDIKIPLILVTATISEEFAAEIIKLGAYDYLLKDRLQRLPTAILNALENCKLENEREKHIREIIASDALFKKAEKIAHFGIWESDLITGLVKWSDEIYELLGYKKNEIEPSLNNVLNTLHPDDKVITSELIQDAIMYRDSLSFDYRIKAKHGGIKYLHSVLLIERDINGKPLKMTGFNLDVTEEMKAKKGMDKMLADVIKRNEELEQFSYIVSHNLRAPVANILGLMNMLKNGEKEKGEQEEIFAGLATSVHRLDDIILDMNHILNVRGSVNDEKEIVSFAELVQDIKQLISETIEKENAEIVTDFAEIDKMETLKSFMHSIFYNLILNSIKFRQKGEAPQIKITSYKVRDKIYLSFKDNGIGMDLSNKKNKIFKLYNRFHGEVDGKGLGLFMVKTQVEALGGKISVLSSVNKGTEFKIEFEA
jgi:PAS domain S-box-containing protein